MKLMHPIEKQKPELLLVIASIMGLAVCAIFYSFCEGISGNDFWWHIKVGQWIVENGRVPTTDIFSWYGVANQIPWTAHEWLADVIFYWIYAACGQWGIFLLSLLSALLLTGLLWKESARHVQRNPLVGGLFFVLFAVVTKVFCYGRPHLFSYFLLYWELKVLYRFFENPNSKGIYTIPILTCLWSNLHGGSATLSYVLCGVFLVVSVLKISIGIIVPTRLKKRAVIKLVVITGLSAAAILVNPVGLEVLLYPYKSFGDSLQMTMISEWRSPDAKNMGDLILFLVPAALMLLGFFAEGKRIQMLDLAVMALLVLLFLRSVRFIMLLYIGAVFCAFPYVPECRIKPISRKQAAATAAVVGVCLVMVMGVGVGNLTRNAYDGKLISESMSQEAVTAVKKDSPGRIFNDYNLGEALIYNDLPVFFDARADLYAYGNLMADGVSLMLLEQADLDAGTVYADVEALVAKYNFDRILILKYRPLYAYLISHPETYVPIYEDDTVGYFSVNK